MPPVTTKTAAAALPASTQELREHLRIDGDDGAHNGTLARCLGTATAMVENDIGRAIVQRVLVLHMDGFPTDGEEITLPMPPAAGVVEIKYLDTDGVQQTLAPSVYVADTARQPGRIVLDVGQSWPATRCIVGAVTVEFTAGYGPVDDDGLATNVPDDLKGAILLLAGHLFENPEAASSVKLHTIPMGVDRILQMYRIPRL